MRFRLQHRYLLSKKIAYTRVIGAREVSCFESSMKADLSLICSRRKLLVGIGPSKRHTGRGAARVRFTLKSVQYHNIIAVGIILSTGAVLRILLNY